MNEQQFYQLLVALGAGLGLAAACGFRVTLPPLALCIASRAGFVQLDPQWANTINSDWSLGVLAVAAVCELGAYCVPWFDHFLDVMAAPAAWLAGTMLSATCVQGIDPVLQWTLAAIVGGGSAIVVHTGTAVIRAGSSLTTGGLGNPGVAAVEGVLATLLSVLAIAVPILALVVLVGGGVVVARRLLRGRGARPTQP